MEAGRDAETRAVAALQECGFSVRASSGTDLVVSTPRETVEVTVKVRRAATYEWEARQLLRAHPGNTLLVVPRAARSLLAVAADDPRLSVLSLDTAELLWRGEPCAFGPRASADDAARDATRRSPWGRWGLMRVLAIAERPWSQAQLARQVGVSQPAISQSLRALGDLVERGAHGWAARDRTQMWDAFLDSYRGPGGVTSCWYGLDGVVAQARTVLTAAADMHTRALSSGDAAADEFAPWRMPGRGVVYVQRSIDLQRYGLAESGPDEATMCVTVPADWTLWATARTWGWEDTVDPLLVAWDVRRSGGPDAAESAVRLKSAVLTRRTDGERLRHE
ncbi:hypothetical protein Lsed01_01437 [Demequina sediminis]|uniref:HTH arsR-type domain-containing protein n=1 Tax=Demequina sediminis TaxID=1930058 RepID=A0ABP9WGQ9_9MICO